MRKLLKNSLAVILAAAMLLCIVPFSASAATYSGTCGENLTWSFDGNGTLTISGIGEMTNWSSHYDVPWHYNKIHSGVQTVKIGNQVTSIGDRAFYDCTPLTSITIPDSIKSIGSYAFRYCNQLTNVDIPSSVTSIGDYAFVSCQKLQSVKIPSGVTSIGEGTFENCVKLENVTIPNTVMSIGKGAFYGCWILPSITIPNSVTRIDDTAFAHCRELSNIVMPDVAMQLGDDIFLRTAYHDDINNWEKGVLYIGNHIVDAGDTTISADNILSGEYTVKNGTKSIANFRFQNELTGITIPSSVGFIGENCFDNCLKLKYIKVNSANTKYASDSANVLYNKNKTTLIKYPAASNTTSYTVPNSVQQIKHRAFLMAENLKSVTLGSDVKTIGEAAFYGCNKLENIVLPQKLEKIELGLFSDCTSLKSVTVGSNVTEIGQQAFAYCKALESITIPGNVESIGLGAFAYCTGMTSVVLNSGVKRIGQVAFGGTTSLEYIHIPSSVTTISEDILIESTGYICTDSSSNYAVNYAKENELEYKICKGHGTVTPEPKNYTLSYNANGGNGAPASQNGAKSYTVSSAQPTRSGYTFLGWSKSSSATSASYVGGDVIALTADTTLYAVWKKNVVNPPASGEIPEIRIKRPSTTSVNYGDILVLTLAENEIPEGCSVKWLVQGTGVSIEANADGTECRVKSIASGNPTVVAKIVDEKGNPVTDNDGVEISDEITVTSKAGFFQKLISFFKNLFGANRVIY